MNFAEARILEYRARISALLVRVEGMKALNARRTARGETTAYNEEAFVEIAEKIDEFGTLIHELAEKVA